jgi:hypothetical protein
MTRSFAMRQRGAALLIMVMIVGLGATWYLVSRLNTESGLAGAAVKSRNQQILNTAKAALIGYVAARASKAGEDRPGALPCPVAPAYFNDTDNDGTVSYPCTLPIVGRFPWKTLGLDKLVDTAGEPLWYAVASGWAGANTVINSDCASSTSGMACATGRLTVDGTTNDVIAVIIAPGPRLNVSASANCTAWTQTRATSGTPDARNYLECQNATWPADATFATTGPDGSFNDQLVTITVGDLLPAVEAAIASRIEREIVPSLNSVYTPAGWGFSGSDPIYPYPAAFASPGPGTGTSSYQGAAGNYKGLLPFNQTQGCTESATDLRCTTVTTGTSATTGLAALMEFSKFGSDLQTAGAGSIRTQSTCSWQSDVYVCTGEYLESLDELESIAVTVTVSVTNVAMGLRKFDSSKITCTAVDDVGAGSGQQNVTCTSTVTLQADGSARITVVTSILPIINAMGWGTYATYSIRVQRAAIGDHALLDTADATTGWFARNEWFRQTYYAVAAGFTAATLPPVCADGVNCLTVANVTPAGKQRAILILAGRSINGSARPSSTLADYLEFGNRTSNYEKLTVTGAYPNAYADTGAANAYVIAAAVGVGRPLQFKAANANTGASTLAATGISATSLVNTDGTSLTASQIQANAVSEVVYDGTEFKLYKRPFNDRVIVVGSNP